MIEMVINFFHWKVDPSTNLAINVLYLTIHNPFLPLFVQTLITEVLIVLRHRCETVAR